VDMDCHLRANLPSRRADGLSLFCAMNIFERAKEMIAVQNAHGVRVDSWLTGRREWFPPELLNESIDDNGYPVYVYHCYSHNDIRNVEISHAGGYVCFTHLAPYKWMIHVQPYNGL
jgi:hypothetical protein